MRLSWVAGLAALAVVPAAMVLWPHLPPMHEDEILPLVPLFLLRKDPAALGGGFLAGCPHQLWGVPLPLTSYVIEGPLKAVAYAVAYPLTRWAYAPPWLIGFYRASNLIWTWALAAGVLVACDRLGGRRAALWCLALLVPDVALVYLGVTDLGRPLHLLAGVVLALVVAAQVERPRWRATAGIAAVVFLGEWNRADFLWFVAATLAGTGLACIVVAPRRWLATAGPVVAGCALGLAGTALVVPEYFRLATSGGAHTIPPTDVARLSEHLSALLHGIDPLGSFQRSFDVGAHDADVAYVAYRRAYVAATLLASAGLAAVGLRERRPALLVFAALPATLLALVDVTAESYLVHHVLVVKPFLYVAVSVLVARLAAAPRVRVPAIACSVVLVVAAAAVQARAFADVTHAPPTTGIYGVSWNQSDAWAAATRDDAPVVIVTDFGAWVPGALASRASQEWESTAIPDEATLDAVVAAHERVGMVVRVGGPNAWLLDQRRHPTVARAVFDRHPGDAWAFLAVTK